MTTGLTDDLTQVDDSRKTAVIDAELDKLNVGIAALQETRLAEDGTLEEKPYKLFCKESHLWRGVSMVSDSP